MREGLDHGGKDDERGESEEGRSPRRDEARYKTVSEYMQGWYDGSSVCCRGR